MCQEGILTPSARPDAQTRSELPPAPRPTPCGAALPAAHVQGLASQ